MSIWDAQRRFDIDADCASPDRRRWPRRISGVIETGNILWRAIELPCIICAMPLGAVAVVKCVDALLDALHY